jgi:ABC-type multidrug transport system ATPase subunit
LSSLAPGTGQGVTGYITFEGESKFDIRAVSSYVPQVGYLLLSPAVLHLNLLAKDDALLGVLTVRETIAYALRLSTVATPMTKRDIDELVNTTVASLGLTGVENHRIGNVIQRGISGGQKRRVTIGTSLVTCPKVSLPI